MLLTLMIVVLAVLLGIVIWELDKQRRELLAFKLRIDYLSRSLIDVRREVMLLAKGHPTGAFPVVGQPPTAEHRPTFPSNGQVDLPDSITFHNEEDGVP